MNNKEYVVYNKINDSFISKKNDLQKMKSICNNNGDIIGVFGYCKNKKQNIIKLTELTNINEIEHNKNVSTDCNNYKIIDYKCNPFLNKNFNTDPVLYRANPNSEHGEVSVLYRGGLDNIIKVNIDCINITYQLPYLINRNKLYEYFINNNYICKYNPQTYSGVKFIYKYPFNNPNSKLVAPLSPPLSCTGTVGDTSEFLAGIGICTCNVKCICLNITFLIFRSGNIIVTGFKDVKQINSVLHEFNNIMKKFSNCK
jgi:TATA-box binding protein (TBP) (component of TFIID and TFIIIB)